LLPPGFLPKVLANLTIIFENAPCLGNYFLPYIRFSANNIVL